MTLQSLHKYAVSDEGSSLYKMLERCDTDTSIVIVIASTEMNETNQLYGRVRVMFI